MSEEGRVVDYLLKTAPCGLDCFNCVFYLAREDSRAMEELERYQRVLGVPVEVMFCRGCRPQGGCIKLHLNPMVSNRSEGEPCPAYACSRAKGVDFCFQCDEFPCDHLHPYADRADKVPHNTKVFNLCLIRKMGLERWAEEKALRVRETYSTKWWSL